MKVSKYIIAAVVALLAMALAAFPEAVPTLSVAGLSPDASMLLPFALIGDTELVKKTIAEITEGFASICNQQAETKQRLAALEQGGARRVGGEGEAKSAGEILTASAEYKALSPDAVALAPVRVGSFHRKAAIVSSSTLVQAQRLGIVGAPDQQQLFVRDLIPAFPVSSGTVEFPRESSGSDIEAEMQYSSPATDGALKKESAMTFTLESEAVRTIAHWIPASRQVLSDAPMLAGYVDTRLTYGVKLREESGILNGDGSAGSLSGLVTQAAAYSSGSGDSDQILDHLIRAAAQVNAVGAYRVTGVVLNPATVTELLLLKDSMGRYLFDSLATIEAKLQARIVASKSMAAGTFLAGDFERGCAIADREDATVRVAEQHADFFVRNMVAILGESRLALVVYSGLAFVTGALAS